MQSVQWFDERAIKVPFECCYCNTAIGDGKYRVKKVVRKDRLTQKYVLEFPICGDCKRRYRNKTILNYLLGILVFSILIFGIAWFSVEINVAWLTIVFLIILERGFQFVFGKFVLEPLRPAILNSDGKLTFHNKEYERRFEALNSLSNAPQEDELD
ncbi:MAG: hypothetical protein C3F13_18165 [Anaerolineales bacterium]|nr:hypothetical protein [Anaerolineae bacterium]PWB49764.1 MAG: hypothetical protein C3F13_18165 [Anaerolineales bacterium]